MLQEVDPKFNEPEQWRQSFEKYFSCDSLSSVCIFLNIEVTIIYMNVVCVGIILLYKSSHYMLLCIFLRSNEPRDCVIRLVPTCSLRTALDNNFIGPRKMEIFCKPIKGDCPGLSADRFLEVENSLVVVLLAKAVLQKCSSK